MQLKMNFESMEISDKLMVCSNGQEVCDYFDTLLDEVVMLQALKTDKKPI